MANKYRVEQDGRVFGHFYAKDNTDAIFKAKAKNNGINAFDLNKPFLITRNGETNMVLLQGVNDD